ncbi:MAG: tetratricopeptide repeat protein [Candidatus Ruthia sp.]|mgnify:CR=1 FL=1|nr:tetratricopeptide repeat protein [Candidatus Ruthturnera sp.]MBT4123235.1 tetratricopeptide repeat protein [Candidatus Ruthturnera sp.]MBT4668176.1 tetratricopeptide repeat protein [Candidatus Ruthturnera sp.]
MKNFIEVGKTEDEQAEQIKKWLRENGPQIIAGIVMGLSGIWGFDYYNNYQHEQSINARTAYLSVVSNPNSPTLATLQSDHKDSDYAQQSVLMMAKHAVSAGNYQQAIEYLSPLLKTENEFIANTAKLRSAAIYLQIGNHDQALSVLGTDENSAFDALYNHTKGDIYLAQNNIDSAKKHYQLALGQLSNDSELSNLIQIKLNDLN